jgi:hypothetical protein
MTDAEAAWAAGLFEGEGSIGVNWVKGRPYASMSMMLTDDDVLYRFRDLIGGSVSTAIDRGGNTKPIWQWRLYGRVKVEPVIRIFWPWLGDRRKHQAAEVLASTGYVDRRRTHCPSGHLLDEANTYVQPRNGGRQCRICKAANAKRYYERRATTEGRGRSRHDGEVVPAEPRPRNPPHSKTLGV